MLGPNIAHGREGLTLTVAHVLTCPGPLLLQAARQHGGLNTQLPRLPHRSSSGEYWWRGRRARWWGRERGRHALGVVRHVRRRGAHKGGWECGVAGWAAGARRRRGDR